MNRQHGFAEIEIGGKKRPVKYGWNALALLEERCKVKLLEMGGLESLMGSAVFLRDIIDVGLREGLRVTDSKPDFTLEDIADWLDEEGFSRNKEFTKLFREAVTDSSLKGLSPEEQAKLKNLAGLMSGKLPSENLASAP
jgi:hypothetical protein